LYAKVMMESRLGLRKNFRIEEIDPPRPEGDKEQPKDGRSQAGMPEMPRPPGWPPGNGQPRFYGAGFRHGPGRAGGGGRGREF
ncbi:hypothetical protein J3Q32_16895, partial [Bordetella holmesii]|nr:hypothetical protein [Bordetella holmesii]